MRQSVEGLILNRGTTIGLREGRKDVRERQTRWDGLLFGQFFTMHWTDNGKHLIFFSLSLLSFSTECLVTLRRHPEAKDKVKALYIRIVAPFPEMERFLQDTIKR